MGGKAVIIIHGYNSSSIHMKGIENEIKKWEIFDQILNLDVYDSFLGFLPKNYTVITPILNFNNGIISTKGTLLENIYHQIKEKIDSNISDIYFIGHSMGGLIARAIIKAIYFQNPESWLFEKNSPSIKGLIMLATPNQGARSAKLKIAGLIDKVETAFYMRLSGYPSKITNSLITKQDQNNIYDEKSNNEPLITQIQQLAPNSEFITWLNNEPTYVDKIPHYLIIGKSNIMKFTNFAWTKEPQKLEESEYQELSKLTGIDIEELKTGEGLEKALDQIVEDDVDNEILSKFEKLINNTLEASKDLDWDKIKSILKDENVIPNDGLVSFDDAFLDGVKIIDISPYDTKISHFTIASWYLPFKAQKVVQEKVKEIFYNLIPTK